MTSFRASTETPAEVRESCDRFRAVFASLRAEIGRVLVGQESVVEEVLVGLFGNGHVLLEGVPGLGKTLLIRTLADALELDFSRIQFTPDLMPADITGTMIVMEDPETSRRHMRFRPGPIFHQLVLADEINRATPKSQSSLLEAMQERSVTIGGTTHPLKQPFFVMATQNPIEQEGTYALPEAQLDRFLLKVAVPYATREEMFEILRRTTSGGATSARAVLDGEGILAAQALARELVLSPHVRDFIIRLVLATHPDGEHMPESVRRHVRVGASPRAAQALVVAGKVLALIDGRYHVSIRDIRRIAPAVLRHRLLLTFEAETDGVRPDDVVDAMLAELPVDESELDGTRLMPWMRSDASERVVHAKGTV